MVAAIAIALAVAGGALAWFVRSGDGGAGTSTVEVSTQRLGTRSVTVPAGHALAVVVDPATEVDAVVALLVSEDDADALADLYDDLDLIEPLDGTAAFPAVPGAADLGEDRVAILRTDIGFAGTEEVLVLPTPAELQVVVAVAPFDTASSGEAELTVATAPLDIELGADPDADELLEAAAAADGLPRPAQELAGELTRG